MDQKSRSIGPRSIFARDPSFAIRCQEYHTEKHFCLTKVLMCPIYRVYAEVQVFYIFLYSVSVDGLWTEKSVAMDGARTSLMSKSVRPES
jgi:hypothetical protein